jgi:2,4-diketo-3-deoxy-L-fuconate hydrolase
MRAVNHDGRAGLVIGDEIVDVERGSAGRFGSDPQALYDRWDEVREWAATAGAVVAGRTGVRPGDVRLAAPVPSPRQVFAIGLNYRAHAQEAGIEEPPAPMVFTKFPTCIGAPSGEIALPPGSVDYEAELVVVIGRRAERVAASEAWGHVAGLTVGQDISERALQTSRPHPPQYSLAKSHPAFGPIGPVVVSPDEFDDPGDLAIGCSLNGEEMQAARTGDMIFDVPALVAYLSSVVTLLPGDLIFTGTPSGVGYARRPRRLLESGDQLVTWVEGIGEMRHRIVP